MNRIRGKVAKLLLKIKKELPLILKDNLFGIYIFGSLTYGGFRPKSSDIDCVVVTKKPIGQKELRLLKNWYERMAKTGLLSKRLEMSYVKRTNLISEQGRVTKTPKYYKGKLYKKSDSDANNPIIWLNIKNTGIALFGPDPKTFVPEITSKLLRKALKTEFYYIIKRPNKFLKEDWSKVYVILTFCRVLYTLKTNKIKSKQAAALWCLKNLPKKWHPIISSALKALVASISWKCLCHPCHQVNEQSRREIANFSQYVLARLNKRC